MGSVVQEFKAGVWAGDAGCDASDAVVMMSSLREEEGVKEEDFHLSPGEFQHPCCAEGRREVSAGEALGKLGTG